MAVQPLRQPVASEYEYLGDFSATPAPYSRFMLCHDCRVSWTGCWDNFQCPRCGGGELPSDDLLDVMPLPVAGRPVRFELADMDFSKFTTPGLPGLTASQAEDLARAEAFELRRYSQESDGDS